MFLCMRQLYIINMKTGEKNMRNVYFFFNLIIQVFFFLKS